MYQQSLVILKPDALQRMLVGKIVHRFENVGLKIHALRFEKITRGKSRLHYAEHVDKSFYPTLEDYITSGPIVIMILGGLEAITKIRKMVGDTVPANALPGTIRGDYAHQAKAEEGATDRSPLRNLIHASANRDDAETEIRIWFKPEEIIDYQLPGDFIHGV